MAGGTNKAHFLVRPQALRSAWRGRVIGGVGRSRCAIPKKKPLPPLSPISPTPDVFPHKELTMPNTFGLNVDRLVTIDMRQMGSPSRGGVGPLYKAAYLAQKSMTVTL